MVNRKRAEESSSSSSSEDDSDYSSSSESDSSPVGPTRKTKKQQTKKGAKKDRKPTHWMVLVKATFAAGEVKGSAGLTEAMKKAKNHLPAFKEAHAEIPTVEAATTWIRSRL